MTVIVDPCICTTCPIRCNFCTGNVAKECPIPGATALKNPTLDNLAQLVVIFEVEVND